MIKKLMKSATAQNAGWIMIGKIAQMVISLVVGLLSARYLGPSNYGKINYSAAYCAFFMCICQLGLNSILVKEFIDHPDEEGDIIGTSLVMRVVSSALSVLTIVCIVFFVDFGDTETIIVSVLYSVSLIFSIFEVINFWYQSKLKSKTPAMITLVSYVLTSLYKVILLVTGKEVEWFAFSVSLDYLIMGALLVYFYRRDGGKKLKFKFSTAKRMLKNSYHFILPGLMVAIYGYTDKIMLKQMMSQADVGYYSTATMICSMWCFVLGAIIDSYYPSIMELHKKDHRLFEKRNRQLYAIVFYISIVVSIIFCIFGELIIDILYGKEYLPAVGALRIVTWYTAFSYLGVARNAWIVCEKKQSYLKYIYFSAALVNVVLNLILIPVWGISGAAFASLLSQFITTMIIPLFIKPLKRNTILMLESFVFKGIK